MIDKKTLFKLLDFLSGLGRLDNLSHLKVKEQIWELYLHYLKNETNNRHKKTA